MDKTSIKGKDGKTIQVYKRVAPERVDMIMQALHKKRLISCFGGLRKMETEDVNEMELNGDPLGIGNFDHWDWHNDAEDWLSQRTGDRFSNYIPTKEFRKAFAEI